VLALKGGKLVAVKIRLTRMGDKDNAFYRVVVTDSKQARDGKYIENLGTYDPKIEDKTQAIKLNADRATYWLGVGAQPTETAKALLVKAGIAKPIPTKPSAKPSAPKPKKKPND